MMVLWEGPVQKPINSWLPCHGVCRNDSETVSSVQGLSRNDSELVRFWAVLATCYVAQYLLDIETRCAQFLQQRVSVKVLQPVVDDTGAVLLDYRVLVQYHSVVLILDGVQEAEVRVR